MEDCFLSCEVKKAISSAMMLVYFTAHSHSRFRSQNRDRTRDHDRNSDRRLTERERFHSISPNRCHSRSPRHNSVSRRRSLSSCVTFKIFFYVKGNRLLGNDVYSIIQVALRLKIPKNFLCWYTRWCSSSWKELEMFLQKNLYCTPTLTGPLLKLEPQ
ncbi:uncharacterized protein LOC143257319 isoform X9 [Tachypleus tridentatus]|uniref:uncharacterized protein LOC143257319 isoform X9 n=1 Tax=Tachypleus tridentatus TaxID=6853 RepID=UPI003FCF7B6B